MRILVIEDEPQLARHVNAALVRHGHLSTVQNDGGAGLQAALTQSPDLIVLDLNLPTIDGFEVLARLRSAQSTARILMLTARGEVGDRVKGLTAGADDYIAKPFAMDELIARVEALGRRSGAPPAAFRLQMGDLHMNLQKRLVTRAGQVIELSPREFDLLQMLMSEPGRFFARTELYEQVWQREHTYDTRTVEMFITRLRRKIDAEFPVPLIHTLRNVGYTIRAPLAPALPP
jgi:two-component system OmpR family response regulator